MNKTSQLKTISEKESEILKKENFIIFLEIVIMVQNFFLLYNYFIK